MTEGKRVWGDRTGKSRLPMGGEDLDGISDRQTKLIHSSAPLYNPSHVSADN